MRPIDLSAGAPATRCPAIQACTRTTLTGSSMILGYYLFPVHRSATGYVMCVQAMGLACIALLLNRQIRMIMRNASLHLQALEAFAIAVPAFLIFFAGTYFFLEQHAAADFN